MIALARTVLHRLRFVSFSRVFAPPCVSLVVQPAAMKTYSDQTAIKPAEDEAQAYQTPTTPTTTTPSITTPITQPQPQPQPQPRSPRLSQRPRHSRGGHKNAQARSRRTGTAAFSRVTPQVPAGCTAFVIFTMSTLESPASL